MSVELYEMEHSPYCIPIAQALVALGVSYESKLVPNWDRSAVIWLTEGAYYQVPMLVHGEEMVIESDFESIDIARYVDQAFGEGKLFSQKNEGLHEILIEFIENDLELTTFKLVDPYYLDTIEGLANRVHTIRNKVRRFGAGCVDQWRKQRVELRIEADRLLSRFESILAGSDYLFGDTPVYADFALFGIVGNLTYRGFNELGPEQDNLKQWYYRLAAFRY